MAVAATLTYDGKGIAESFSDVIFDISPEETPLLSMAKRLSTTNTYHQWQTDSLAAPAANAQLEGDAASFATVHATTVLGNYTQISTKTIQISGTYDAVKKYGRKSEVAYQLMKKGKELKRDIEYGLSRNAATSSDGVGTARTSAGLESWIVNRALTTGNSGGTTPGFSGGGVVAPTDGTLATFTAAHLKTALGLAWADGGNPSKIFMSSKNKALFAGFTGVATSYNDIKNKPATIVGAVDIFVSDYGTHSAVLSRYVRDEAVMCVDPEYVGVAFLRPIQKKQLADDGDREAHMLLAEWTLVVQNPDAHAKVQGTGV